MPAIVMAEPGDSIGVNVDQAKLVKLPPVSPPSWSEIR